MSAFDLVIRGGSIHDGGGGAPFVGDVAIAGDRIAEVGRVEGRGVREIDAEGLIVTPGFVDIHTHYDGQVTWESGLEPSSQHGVTTVVTGNCGVGFAPCRAADHTRLIELMAGVEDIPEIVMAEGLPWTWETYPQYLDVVEARPHELNIGCYLPHSALRVFVMGQRAADRERATGEDIRAMARLAREARLAGALGFATSRSLAHKTIHGEPIPTVRTDEAELMGIAQGLKSGGGGVLQLISDYGSYQEVAAEFAMFRRLAEQSGQPILYSLVEAHGAPAVWRELLDLSAEARAEGLAIRPQVIGRPPGVLLGHELSYNPFGAHPSYARLAPLPFAERVAELRKPQVRAQILAEKPQPTGDMFVDGARLFHRMFELGDPPNYEPGREESITARAAREGRPPEALAYDLLLERDGRAMLMMTLANYSQFNLDSCHDMMTHPDAVLGLGDGGAHCGLICDASWPTTMLAYWTRDRRRGERLSLPWVVRAQTWETAQAVGLCDRGLLKAGYRADVNVIDHDNLRMKPPEVVYDQPSGGKRVVQGAEGYRATIVNGVPIRLNDRPTGALPGRLARGPAARPH